MQMHMLSKLEMMSGYRARVSLLCISRSAVETHQQACAGYCKCVEDKLS